MITLLHANLTFTAKSFYEVNKTVFQLGNVGQHWRVSLMAFQHCTPCMIIHWHINLVQFLLFYIEILV